MKGLKSKMINKDDGNYMDNSINCMITFWESIKHVEIIHDNKFYKLERE